VCDAKYNLGGIALPIASSTIGLGVYYDHSIVSIASVRAKVILKCFATRDSFTLSKAFTVFVRPSVEFSSVKPWLHVKIK